MILYTVKDRVFYNLSDFKQDLSDLSENGFPNTIYVNMTNRCSCSCTFCLRNLKKFNEHNSLWLKEEPSVEEVKKEFDRYDWSHVKEIVFCGFGEPTMRLDDVLEVGRYLKSMNPQVPLRINTNGLSDLVFGEPTAGKLEGVIDTVSVSLNASNAQKYLDITRNRFGLASYEAMLSFARACQRYVPHVVVTVVDVIGEEEVEACRKVCEENGLPLRVRAYEAN
ncbi:MAG: TatD family nuclease-associated radical SAM protein [Eubacterium sp.]|nr:TatD family nuclease-associated radical SAM protein [Eubacterium sp.]MDD7208854.1 TatD family nuclease-associated radical SAM protein [Lachnospiraceae bacterium]